MAGLTIGEIREALAAQLRANLDRETNISVRGEARPAPVITIEADPDEYVEYWGSFGAGGLSVVRFVLVVDPGGADESGVLRLDDFLSVGTGNNSSVLDALMVDRTLGGVVGDVFAQFRGVDVVNVTAQIAVEVRLNRVGAEVG